MAATHLEARAARVHVRVKVFEELLAAFRQQCRRTLRHLFHADWTQRGCHALSFSTALDTWRLFRFFFWRILLWTIIIIIIELELDDHSS